MVQFHIQPDSDIPASTQLYNQILFAIAVQMMEAAEKYFDQQDVGLNRFHLLPTLCWMNAGDGFLHLLCVVGAALALLLIIGIAPAPCLFLLWLVYLSLTVVCRDFLGFQWDTLLLETGFLAIVFAPLQILPGLKREAAPSRIVLWLLCWLLYDVDVHDFIAGRYRTPALRRINITPGIVNRFAVGLHPLPDCF